MEDAVGGSGYNITLYVSVKVLQMEAARYFGTDVSFMLCDVTLSQDMFVGFDV